MALPWAASYRCWSAAWSWEGDLDGTAGSGLDGPAEKLEELKQLCDVEAEKYNVYPLYDDVIARLGKQQDRLFAGKDEIVFYAPNTVRIAEKASPPIKGRSYSISVELDRWRGGGGSAFGRPRLSDARFAAVSPCLQRLGSKFMCQVVQAALALAATAGCVHARNFRSPQERITPHSAYSEHSRVRVDAGLLAPSGQNFVANVGIGVTAVRDHLEFSVNLAHGALGVVSAESKFMFFDSRWYAIGGRVGFTYANPRTFWMLPKSLRQELGTIQLANVPIELWQSFPITGWFGFHLGVDYRSSALWGSYQGDALLADANIASRSFAFQPYIDFFAGRRVALTIGARLPVFAEFVEATEVVSQVSPELIVGVRSVEWVRRPFLRTAQLEFAAETRFGRNTHLRLGVNVGAFRPIKPLVVTPSLSLYWRFR